MGINLLWTRVDNRLVHGQVGVQWAGFVKPNLIVVADDQAAEDKIQQSLMKMTADMYGIGIRFFSLQKCADVINNASASQRIMLVVRSIQSARFLIENGVPIDKLNLGNLHFTEGKHVSKEPHVYLSAEDEEDIEKIKAFGVKVFIQIAPGDTVFDM